MCSANLFCLRLGLGFSGKLPLVSLECLGAALERSTPKEERKERILQLTRFYFKMKDEKESPKCAKDEKKKKAIQSNTDSSNSVGK